MNTTSIDDAKHLAARARADFDQPWLRACIEAANAFMGDDAHIPARLAPTLYYASPTRRDNRIGSDPVALIRATMALVAHSIGPVALTNKIDFEAGAVQLLADYADLPERDAPCDVDSLGLRLQYALEEFNDPMNDLYLEQVDTLSRLLVELSVALHQAQQDDQCD